MFNLLRITKLFYAEPILYSFQQCSSYSLPSVLPSFLPPSCLLSFPFFFFFDSNHPNRYEVVSYCDFDVHFLKRNDVGHFLCTYGPFLCLWRNTNSSSVSMLNLGLFVLLLLKHMNSFCTLIVDLYRMDDLQIFSSIFGVILLLF